jgi:subtilase family serine protease
MRRRSVLAALVGAAALVPVAAQGANPHANYHAVCPGPPAGYAHCHALVVTDAHGKPVSNATPSGLSPANIESAYGFSTSATAGAGQTIAIVDAYDDPSAESDLGVFSSQFGLPACTTASGCFKKVNQTGGTSYPRSNTGWGLEISLDIQWAHAIAPGAHILLVEASSNSFTNLLAAEDYASAHAGYVSNSWGGSEFNGETSYDSHFSHGGVSFFVSSGDAGLPAEYPSASSNVISVGGTTLHFSGGTLTSETGWSDGGGGCSSYETATSAQAGFGGYSQVHCNGKRATPDVSLDADPASGVSVYDSYGYGGWIIVGGTSASSPMWAARSAVAGAVVNSAYVYGSNIPFRDITSGNNGASCLVGFDLCSGRGSWNDGGGTSIPTLTQILVSPGSANLTQGQTAQFTATGKDQYGNPISLSSVAWSTTAPGSVSPTSGTATTFTASTSTTGSGYVTATSGGVSGSAAVTVAAASSSTMTVTVSAGTPSKKGPNYRVPVTVVVSGSSGPLAGASAALYVYSGSTCSGSAVASGSSTTGSSGQASFTFTTRTTGTWCALATVDATGYSTGTGTKTFTTP